MLSNTLYGKIVMRVTGIVLLSLILGFLIFKIHAFGFSIICFLLILITAVNLILFLNKTNSNIGYFFDSVKNNDTNLSFSIDDKYGYQKELHKSMNKVNRQIQDLKIENRKQEQFFQKILEMMATAIIICDKSGQIHHVNSAARKLFAMDTLNHVKQIERIDKRLFSAVSTIKPRQKQLVAINSSRGEISLLLRATASGTAEDELTIISIQDIKNELDEKEIDAWMKLIRVLMHEIMNSIAPITSLSESLQKIYRTDSGLKSPEKLTTPNIEVTIRGLEAIMEQGKGLMKFVESYRRLSHIPKPDLKLFNVSQLFNRVKILTECLEKKESTAITFRLQKPDYELFADINQLSQVLINLIKNALEANESNPDCQINVNADVLQDNNLEISVADNGPGIGMENLENIFVPFFTTHEKGSGIGLSLSRQIMGMHNGSLTVHSIPWQETVFSLKFRN
jgi:two-component system, NtrC family, nitrogen regulation sensor histidine kinase NtrY